jgi:hypothetical protein
LIAHEARAGLAAGHRLGMQELDGYALVELEVRGRNHHAHATRAQHPLDLELAGQDLTGLHGSGGGRL